MILYGFGNLKSIFLNSNSEYHKNLVIFDKLIYFDMIENPKFAVIGGGSWATAIAKMLCVNLSEIAWYMRNNDAIEHLKLYKHNPNYLTGVEFDLKKLKLTSDINEAVAYADYLIFAIPSAFVGTELKKLTVDMIRELERVLNISASVLVNNYQLSK